MCGPEYGDRSRGFRQTILIYTQNGIPLRPVYRARVCCGSQPYGISVREPCHLDDGGTVVPVVEGGVG